MHLWTSCEDTAHYVLWCPLYHNQRSALFNEIKKIVPGFEYLPSREKVNTLLCKNIENYMQITIAEFFQAYITQTGRFNTLM